LRSLLVGIPGASALVDAGRPVRQLGAARHLAVAALVPPPAPLLLGADLGGVDDLAAGDLAGAGAVVLLLVAGGKGCEGGQAEHHDEAAAIHAR
jgi:hypothetical protein